MLSKNVPFWSILKPVGGIPSHLGHKTLGKKVCYCQSLSSNFILLGASYIDKYNPSFHLKSQMFHSNLAPLRLLQKGIRCMHSCLCSV